MSSFVMAAQETKQLEAPVYEISVATGELVVTDSCGEKPVTEVIESGDAYTRYGGTPSLALYSPGGAHVTVTYVNDPAVPQEAPERPSGVSAKKRAKKAA